MAQLDTLDIIVLAALLLGTVAYFTKGTYWAVYGDPYGSSLANANGAAKAGKSRNILEKMDETDKNCVVFLAARLVLPRTTPLVCPRRDTLASA